MAVVAAPPAAGIRWGRVILGAFLLELALFVVLIPIGLVFGMPSPTGQTDATIFFVAVPIGCVVLGFLFGMWVGRTVAANVVLHGMLLGILATLMYLGICSIPPSTIRSAAAMYGVPLFFAVNGLRIAGCVGGAWYQGKRVAGR